MLKGFRNAKEIEKIHCFMVVGASGTVVLSTALRVKDNSTCRNAKSPFGLNGLFYFPQ